MRKYKESNKCWQKSSNEAHLHVFLYNDKQWTGFMNLWVVIVFLLNQFLLKEQNLELFRSSNSFINFKEKFAVLEVLSFSNTRLLLKGGTAHIWHQLTVVDILINQLYLRLCVINSLISCFACPYLFFHSFIHLGNTEDCVPGPVLCPMSESPSGKREGFQDSAIRKKGSLLLTRVRAPAA